MKLKYLPQDASCSFAWEQGSLAASWPSSLVAYLGKEHLSRTGSESSTADLIWEVSTLFLCFSVLPISCSPKLIAGSVIRLHIPIVFPEFLNKYFVSTCWCMRWIYKYIAFSLEGGLSSTGRGSRWDDNHKSDQSKLSQLGFYFLCESIFSSLRLFHFIAGFLKAMRSCWTGYLGISSR